MYDGRDWTVSGDGTETLRILIDPPDVMRHDEVNGIRVADPVQVEFTGDKVDTGTG